MSKERNYLQSLLAGESRAYGFTIAFWGSGAILISTFGVPKFPEAISYGSGAVTGFALLALFAFRNTLGTVDDSTNNTVVLSMIHYIAALLPILASKIIVENVSIAAAAFFLAGASVSIVYNSLSVLEEDIAEFIS